MASFFKKFGQGILYVLAFPFIVAILCITAAIGLFIFIILGIKAIVEFFRGTSIFADLPEDIEAKKILSMSQTNNVQPSTTNYQSYNETLQNDRQNPYEYQTNSMANPPQQESNDSISGANNYQETNNNLDQNLYNQEQYMPENNEIKESEDNNNEYSDFTK